jgi:hypothetical protein
MTMVLWSKGGGACAAPGLPGVYFCKLLKTKGVTVTINVWFSACKGEEKIPKLAFIALQVIHFIALTIVASMLRGAH